MSNSLTTWDVIKAKAQQYGVSMGVLAPIVLMESGGDPTQENSLGAVGLLQLLKNGGQGSGHTSQELKDPATNLDIGLPYIKAAQTKALQLGLDPHSVNFLNYIMSHSGHDAQYGVGESADAIKVADKYWNQQGHGVSTLQHNSSGYSARNPTSSKGGGNSVLDTVGGTVYDAAGNIVSNIPIVGGVVHAANSLGGIADSITGVGTDIQNIGPTIGSAIEAPFMDARSYLFDHAFETVVLLLALLLLVGGALSVYRQGAQV